MSEVYVEHLVKREKASGLKFLKILLIMLTVVFGLMGLMMMFYVTDCGRNRRGGLFCGSVCRRGI